MVVPSTSSDAFQSDEINNNIDISNYTNKKLSDKEKISLLENFWRPNENLKFLLTATGKNKGMKKFNYKWLTKYFWLAYSKVQDGVYCKYCFLFAQDNVGKNSQFLGELVKNPFNKWRVDIEKF